VVTASAAFKIRAFLLYLLSETSSIKGLPSLISLSLLFFFSSSDQNVTLSRVPRRDPHPPRRRFPAVLSGASHPQSLTVDYKRYYFQQLRQREPLGSHFSAPILILHRKSWHSETKGNRHRLRRRLHNAHQHQPPPRGHFEPHPKDRPLMVGCDGSHFKDKHIARNNPEKASERGLNRSLLYGFPYVLFTLLCTTGRIWLDLSLSLSLFVCTLCILDR
jgi:hypothetical protein